MRRHQLATPRPQAYKALVKGARSQRLEEVLGQTEACLKSFAAKLGISSKSSKALRGAGQASNEEVHDGSRGGSDGGPLAAPSDDCPWTALAERLIADVPCQPAMLQGPGPLREYQMHVRATDREDRKGRSSGFDLDIALMIAVSF